MCGLDEQEFREAWRLDLCMSSVFLRGAVEESDENCEAKFVDDDGGANNGHKRAQRSNSFAMKWDDKEMTQNRESFAVTVAAMNTAGIDTATQHQIWKVNSSS